MFSITGMPVWEKELGEYEEEELASGEKLKLPMAMMLLNLHNMTGVTSEAETAYPSREPEFIPSFQWGS
jgi:hypothetical protein